MPLPDQVKVNADLNDPTLSDTTSRAHTQYSALTSRGRQLPGVAASNGLRGDRAGQDVSGLLARTTLH